MVYFENQPKQTITTRLNKHGYANNLNQLTQLFDRSSVFIGAIAAVRNDKIIALRRNQLQTQIHKQMRFEEPGLMVWYLCNTNVCLKATHQTIT